MGPWASAGRRERLVVTACPRCHGASFDEIHRGRIQPDDAREVIIGMCWSCGIVDVLRRPEESENVLDKRTA